MRYITAILLSIFTFSILHADFVHDQNLEAKLDQLSSEPGAVTFTPPKGWGISNSDQLPKQLKVVVVGKGKSMNPPRMVLATEPFSGTLDDYRKKIKETNEKEGTEWRDLGFLKTHAGDAFLSQVDIPTEFGTMRMMSATLVHEDIAYNLAAAAPKDEFSNFYEEFFQSFRSFRINAKDGKNLRIGRGE